MEPMPVPMQIEVYADVACPWCYIGERRLARALAARPELRVERHWRPFQLQPGMPPEGLPWAEFADRKFGGLERAGAAFAQVIAAGAGEGITFDFARMPKAPNTREAHRLIGYATEQGREWAVAEGLFAAYFSEARDITDREELVAIAAAAGLEAEGARAFLDGAGQVAAVEASQGEAAGRGVQGVPFFVFDGRYALSGAQPLEVFHEVFDVIAKEEGVAERVVRGEGMG